MRAPVPATSTRRASSSRVEEGEHRQHAAVVVRRLRDAQLAEDVRDVGLDRLRAEHELLAYPVVRAAFCHQLEHLTLTRGQRAERIVIAAPSQELRNHFRIDCRAAAADAAHGAEELVDLDDAILEQVAE